MMSNKPKPDEFEVMSDTPMTDLYGQNWGLRFAAHWGEVYHGYRFVDGRLHSLCGLDVQGYPLRGSITAEDEADISRVRRPYKLCLAKLRKAKEAANE